MNPPAASKKMNIGLLMIGLGLLIGLLWFSGLENSVLAGPPPRNTSTPPPAATPLPSQIIKSEMPTGAFITLQTTAGVWTGVQWQDSNGDWHDVSGWRGTAVDGRVQWWVAQKDFGTGPFRWAVYQPAGDGEPVSVSEPFMLPVAANETMSIVVP